MAGLQLTGLASGFDWKSVVDQLMALEHTPADRLSTEKSVNLQKLSALTTLGTKLTDLKTAATALKADGLFTGRTAASSTLNSTWTLNAADATATGSYTIAVSQLATASTRTGTADISSGLNGRTDDIVSGLTIASLATAVPVTTPASAFFTVNGQQIAINADDSLQDVFDRIYTSTGNDVQATYDHTTDKITLTATNPGTTEIVLGAANDTSNFLSVMKLANNGSATVASGGALATASTSLPLASARLRTPITAVDGAGNGAFSINGVSIAYNVNTDSLSAILTRIGASSAGVSASYDAANDRVVLANKTTGSTGMTVSEASGGLLDALGLVAGSTAGSTLSLGQNANFTINGGPQLTSTTNTLDVSAHGIAGLSVTVNSQTTETISVKADSTSMRSSIEDFVTKFNAVQQYIGDQTNITAKNGKVTAALLASNREIQTWTQSLRAMAFGAIGGLSGTINKLGDLGIEFTSAEPTLSIKDSAKLDAALQNQAADVAEFFSTASTGLVAKFSSFFLNTIGGSITGIDDGTIGGNLGSQQTSLTKANTGIDQQIADIERRLVVTRALLESSFIKMESAQSKSNNVLQQLNSAFGTSSTSSSST